MAIRQSPEKLGYEYIQPIYLLNIFFLYFYAYIFHIYIYMKVRIIIDNKVHLLPLNYL